MLYIFNAGYNYRDTLSIPFIVAVKVRVRVRVM